MFDCTNACRLRWSAHFDIRQTIPLASIPEAPVLGGGCRAGGGPLEVELRFGGRTWGAHKAWRIDEDDFGRDPEHQPPTADQCKPGGKEGWRAPAQYYVRLEYQRRVGALTQYACEAKQGGASLSAEERDAGRGADSSRRRDEGRQAPEHAFGPDAREREIPPRSGAEVNACDLDNRQRPTGRRKSKPGGTRRHSVGKASLSHARPVGHPLAPIHRASGLPCRQHTWEVLERDTGTPLVRLVFPIRDCHNYHRYAAWCTPADYEFFGRCSIIFSKTPDMTAIFIAKTGYCYDVVGSGRHVSHLSRLLKPAHRSQKT